MPRMYSFDEVTYKVGKNAKENWDLIKKSENNDIWIHLHDYPSCHVIIENTKSLGKEHILYGCCLCKENSKYKNDKKTKVSVLQMKYVKKGKVVGEAKLKKDPIIYVI
jgi:predicted ribosome quality control (RQC) complex YloA/Tae2 family protein